MDTILLITRYLLILWPSFLLLSSLILFIIFFNKKYREYHPIMEFKILVKGDRLYWPENTVHRSLILLVIHALIILIRIFNPLQYFKVFYKEKAESENNNQKSLIQKKKCKNPHNEGYLPSYIKEIYILIWILYDFTMLFYYNSSNNFLTVMFTTISIFQIIQVFYSCLYYNFFRSAIYKDAKVHNFHRSIVLTLMNYLEILLLFAVLYHVHSYGFVYSVNSLDIWYNAIYYSATTITTLGFGDIYPTVGITKFFTISEVLIGTVILVLALSRIVGSLKIQNDAVNDNKE